MDVPIKVIANTLIVKGDSFIIVKEGIKSGAPGKWNIPGGKLEAGESILQAAVREAKEETGLDIKLTGFLGVYEHRNDFKNIVKNVFIGEFVGGELKDSDDEIEDVKWIKFDKFLEMSDETLRTPDLKIVVKDFQKRGVIDLNRVRSIEMD